MNTVLAHPATNMQLQKFAAVPSHALMLIGPAGSGTLQLAQSLAEDMLGSPGGTFADHPYTVILGLQKDDKSIGIDRIRELEQFLSLKVPTDNVLNRVVIVENGELLTIEAQNGLLKTLEEPPIGTTLIITVAQEQALLPTIMSRVQKIVVPPVPQDLAADFFAGQGYDMKDIQRVYAMTAGRPQLMKELLEEPEHPLWAASQLAREIVAQPAYERLLRVDELTKRPEELSNLLFILQQMASHGLRAATGGAMLRWQRVLEASYEATEALQANAQPKLALTDLMLSL